MDATRRQLLEGPALSKFRKFTPLAVVAAMLVAQALVMALAYVATQLMADRATTSPSAVSGTIERGMTPAAADNTKWYLFADGSGPCQEVSFGPEDAAARLLGLNVPGSTVNIYTRNLTGDDFSLLYTSFPQPDGTTREVVSVFVRGEGACWRVIGALKAIVNRP
jgi:hypothetical protein